MAAIVQNDPSLTIGQTIYWRDQPVEFHGFIAATDATMVRLPDNYPLTCVLTTDLSTGS